jgi:3-methyladenine DNA glycosylase/8-oxoguanine DNA glycosylase
MPLLTVPTVSAPAVDRTLDIGATLGWYRHGGGDPTTWLSVSGRGTTSSGRFVRATFTPDGPGTLVIEWTRDHVSYEAFGPGAAWLEAQAPRMLGADDDVDHGLEDATHPIVAAAAVAGRHVRFGSSGNLYHELLPTIIEQRITIVEAHEQWQRLCFALGDTAPGPFTRLLLPPHPEVLMRQPSWWFHPLGIERKRAEPLIKVGWHASKFWQWAALGPDQAAAKLRLIPGVGQWTVGSVLGPALGDADAVAVGDYHLKNLVAFNLAGVARGTDERMLELLEPYAGQRGRVVHMLTRHGSPPPKFGPKQRILPMRAW